ncbi:MAG: IS110 family transposase [Geodermatophilales bacterium]|nr:IS110 family transposase [Geodermatophilales bacterium]
MHDPTLTAAPTGPVFAGIDWASADHAVCVLDAAGTVLWRHTVSHSRAGLTRLTARLRELEVSRVGIERPDGPVVEALLDAGLRVAVVPPRQVKNLRSRYTRAGKDDRFDAYVLADAMRTDGHRFTDLTRDSAATIGLRALVRARQDLVEVRVGLVNQLRATLELAFPGAVGLFFDLHSPIARAFLRRFPTAAEAAVLDEDSMAAWLAAEGYSGRTPAAVFLDRLRAAPAGLTGAAAAARRHVTLALLAGIDAIEAQAAELTRRIKEALAQHPDAPIFTSLPRAGQIRAAGLLAEIGDARGRYPDAPTLAAAAGVCPYTDESGKHRSVLFRFKADTKLRRALTDFADDSRHASPWAADVYARARARGMRHPQAVRVLARAWTFVIWRCWQDRVPYDPARHGALNRYLSQDAAAAA